MTPRLYAMIIIIDNINYQSLIKMTVKLKKTPCHNHSNNNNRDTLTPIVFLKNIYDEMNVIDVR